MEFLRAVAAYFSGIRIHDPKFETEAFENRGVGGMHAVVRRIQAGLVDIEGIGILHDEFARPHHAKAWPDFIAELGLNLVEVNWQLLVAAQFAACDVGDDFLMGRPKAVVAFMAVVHA